ncbi:MAG TPA: hypothetical protein VFC51_16310 [Chloroflexota bacterium]|nr:hypothetical protein [Chloroflexota bacterium]
MTTRAGLRSLVRQELGDAGGTQLWADALLNEWIAEAVRLYGRTLPKEATATITTVADQAAYALPANLERVLRVEYPAGVPWSPRLALRQTQGEVGAESGGSYGAFAGNLELNPAPSASGEAVRLDYLARYAEPAADGDTLETPASDDDILLRLTVARALRWITLDEAKRQRFERQRGASASDVATLYEQEARDLMEERKRRVRTGTLSWAG